MMIERDDEGLYVRSVPQIPGCHIQGRSLDELMQRIREAVQLCLEVEGSPDQSLEFIGIQRITIGWVNRAPRLVWLELLYLYGTFRCMKKTLHIDDKTLREAKEACGALTDTETVRLGLEALIRHAAYQRLRKLKGTEKSAPDVPRRRAKAGKKRSAA